MREQLDRRLDDQSVRARLSRDEADRMLRELHAQLVQGQGDADSYDYDNEPVYEDEVELPIAEQMPQGPKRSNPSDWGASSTVDAVVSNDYYSVPLEKEKLKFPSGKVLVALGFTAAWTSVLAYSVYESEIDNPYSVVASLPVIGKDDPVKKELLDKLLANCTDENVGEPLYKGAISAESSMIWNVPNADGTLSPLLPTRLDPGSKDERHLKAIIENSTVTIGACDTGGRPAINIRDNHVKIDLAAIESRISLGREKVYAEGIHKERLDESAKLGAFPQTTADALSAEMTNPKNIDVAVSNTLYDVGRIITAKDSVYDNQVEEVTRGKIVESIKAQLKVKSPGIDYDVEVVNDIPDTVLVGINKTDTDKLTVTDAKITKATIVADPNTEKS